MRRLRRNPDLRPSPHGKNLEGRDLSRQDLSSMDLSGADLSYAHLEGANLRGANLSGAVLIYANLGSADLTSTNLYEANLFGAHLVGANFSRADLTRVALSEANLHRANLTGANLTSAQFMYANLSGARFHDANLSGAHLHGANITGADFRGADLTGVEGMPRFGPLREHYEIKTPTSPAFKRWFGESVVVGDDKKPVVVYHGTDKGGFTQFDPTKRDEHHNAFYFVDNMDVAETYVDPTQPVSRPDPLLAPREKHGIYRLYIKLVNPMIIEGAGRSWAKLRDPRVPGLHKTYDLAKWAEAHGHDGVIFKDIVDDGGQGERLAPPATVYAVFDPRAIKSATANVGSYDPNDPDIRHNPRHRLSRAPRRR